MRQPKRLRHTSGDGQDEADTLARSIAISTLPPSPAECGDDIKLPPCQETEGMGEAVIERTRGADDGNVSNSWTK
jgi:hypothetical protein